MSKNFEQTGEDPEDLLSIGTIGLIKGINTFDSQKGTRLATYAARCIENEILMFLRSIKKTKQDMSLQEAVGTDKEGNELTLLDLLGTDPNLVPNEVERKLLQKRLQHLIKKLKKKRAKSFDNALWLVGRGEKYPERSSQPFRHITFLCFSN